MNRQIDDYEVFYDTLWGDYISEKIVSTVYLNKYRDFIDVLTFDAYQLHIKSGLDVKIIGKTLESFFHNLFKFKGGNEYIEDDKLNLF